MSYVNSSQPARLITEETGSGSYSHSYSYSYSYNLSLAAAIVGVSLFLLYRLYRMALPKPIKNMPHDPRSAARILGDLPDLAAEVSRTGDLAGWLHRRAESYGSPVSQIFLRPLSAPVVLLADFRETQDICMRRREFDRGQTMRDLFRGPSPDHHITLRTGDEWKAHRRLLQDLMSPPFLRDVAAPAIHANVANLVALWERKARIADGRPFNAYEDIFYAALDAVTAFSFGEAFPHNATKPVADLVCGLDEVEVARLRRAAGEAAAGGAIEFPTVECDEVLTATLDVSTNIERLHSSPFPVWKWRVISKFPPLNRTMRLKNDFIVRELEKAVARQKTNGDDDTWMRSAVDLLVQREKKLAREEKRKPDFFSPTMKDELFGVITGGHDTTSTTMLWGLKFLADHPEFQTKLRIAMEKGFAEAKEQKRSLRVEEITQTNVPYLSATMEEILRCAATAPLVEREALRDTVLLGYHIPKGTKVFCLGQGASIKKPAYEIDEMRRSETGRLAVKNRGKTAEWSPADVGAFNPERWLVPADPADPESESKTGPAVEFDSSAGPQMAFGLGRRSCFGKRLAYVELRILLSLIVWNFEILKCPEALSGYEGRDGVTHKPVKNYVRLRKVER